MRRCILVFVVLLFTGTVAMTKSIFPYTTYKEVLPNGLTAVLIPMESPGLVAYYSVVRTGSRDEFEPGKSGFAHFFEHMMFRGTKRHPGPVYDSLITGIGADANAYTTDDYTAYHLNFATEDLEKVMDLESDRFQNLQYEEREFQTEAGAVYGEYRKGITSPFALLNEKLQDLAYDVHTYKHTTIGFEADIKAMPGAYAYSKSFYERYYRPENVVILIAGDFHMQGTLTLLRKYYGKWTRGYVPPQIRQEPPQKGERTADVTYGGKTLPVLNIAYKGEAFDPANRSYVAAILLGDLVFGETSDLYKKLYIQKQRVEFIQGSIPMNRDVPLFEIVAMVKREEDIPAVRDEVYQAIAKFQTHQVDGQRLADMKQRRKYGFLMNLDTPNKVAGGLARFAALTGGIDVVNSFYTTLDRITPGEIQKAAQKYFRPERRTVVVLKGDRQ
jgi:zinc protease